MINLDVGTVHIQLHQNPPGPHSGRSILKAVIARHEPQALTVQIPGRDRHSDTVRAYLSTARARYLTGSTADVLRFLGIDSPQLRAEREAS